MDRDSFDKARIAIYRDTGLAMEEGREATANGQADIVEIITRTVIKRGSICGFDVSKNIKVNNMSKRVDSNSPSR